MKNTKRILAMVLTIVMVLSLFAGVVSAEEAKDATLVTSLATGDKVVIYCASSGKALGAFASAKTYYNGGVDVTATDGKIAAASLTSDIEWDVTKNEDGTYYFSQGGKKLSMDTSYSSTPADKANDKWALETATNGFYIKNVGRTTTEKPMYLEWYAGNGYFSGYGPIAAGNEAVFTMTFYKVGGEVVPPVTEKDNDSIVILYTNDVHCNYLPAAKNGVSTCLGYAGVAAYKADMEAAYANVALVDAGDHSQGGAIGTLSNGAYIIDIMNKVGYDFAAIGNHEFDYGMAALQENINKASFTYLACNLTCTDANGLKGFEPYKIVTYGTKKVAYVGVSTPESFTKSTPTYFQDANGNYIYSFAEGNNGKDLYASVQKTVDAVKGQADYVILLAHLGTDGASSPWMSTDVIANTTDIDAVIDGHSHTVMADNTTAKNKNNENVALTSTGTALANLGKMIIAKDGTITTELISAEKYTKVDETTATYIASITDKFQALLNTTVAHTDVNLTIKNAEGTREVRKGETNLGDLCADAYRTVLGADIGLVNGGGVRADIAAGDITYAQIIAVHPFGNMACLVQVSGQTILDALEHSASVYPNENGGFLQVSGLKYTIDAAVTSPVVKDDKGMFVKVDGARRVKDVYLMDANGKYTIAIDPAKIYTVASHNYMLKSAGDGYCMFKNDPNFKVLQDEVLIDNQVLIKYMTSSGFKSSDYANISGSGRITIVNKDYDTVCGPFADIVQTAWYHEAVHYMIKNGYMSGTDKGFEPNLKLNRAMLVMILYRVAGSEAVDGYEIPFTDVAAKAWYHDAVAWAYHNDIVSGTTTTTFGPSTPASREMVVTVLYKFCKATEDTTDHISTFADYSKVSEYAKKAMNWAVGKGIISGNKIGGVTLLDPKGTTTRAQIAQMLSSYLKSAK